jgi:hypothetical protein
MQDPIQSVTKAKRGCGCSSSGRVPAQQMRGPEFNPSAAQNNNNNNNDDNNNKLFDVRNQSQFCG